MKIILINLYAETRAVARDYRRRKCNEVKKKGYHYHRSFSEYVNQFFERENHLSVSIL